MAAWLQPQRADHDPAVGADGGRLFHGDIEGHQSRLRDGGGGPGEGGEQREQDVRIRLHEALGHASYIGRQGVCGGRTVAGTRTAARWGVLRFSPKGEPMAKFSIAWM